MRVALFDDHLEMHAPTGTSPSGALLGALTLGIASDHSLDKRGIAVSIPLADIDHVGLGEVRYAYAQLVVTAYGNHYSITSVKREVTELAAEISAQVEQAKRTTSPQHTDDRPWDLASTLTRLSELHQRGVLTSEEFSAAKARTVGLHQD